jgi:DNA invertase Pin-like site-specific DNA recombinase
MTKSFSYLRVSGQGQIDGHGLQRQREAIERFAAGRYEVVREFVDAGVSGTNDLGNRPELGALMRAVESDGVKVVLIEKLDRLARDLIVQEMILIEMVKAGVRLVSVAERENLASDDPTRRLTRHIMGAVAEYDKAMIVMKLRAARDAKRLAVGKCEGAKAYGEVDELERQAVQRVRELRRKRPGQRRMGPARIARVLQDEGHPTRRGGQWDAQKIKGILNGPVYAELGRRCV